jgi:hypothetical protein
MEIIIGLIVLVVVGYFVFRPREVEKTATVVEYKVEAPTSVAEQATQAVVESLAPEAPAKKPRAKKPAAPKAPAKKPAAKKVAAKKPAAKKTAKVTAK